MSDLDVSVVVPAFQAASTLGRTLDSCLREISAQNIVVVLDGQDEELERIAKNSAEGVQVLILPKGSGAPACRNAGFALVKTKYVMFLDADDYVEGGLLQKSCDAAEKSNADVVFGPFCFEMPDGVRKFVDNVQRYVPLEPATVMQLWLIGGYTPPCAVVWRSGFVRQLNGWNEALKKNQDGDLIFRAMMRGAVLVACPTGLGIYSQEDNPGRITLRHNRGTLDSQFAVLENIRTQLQSLTFDPRRELGLAYYSLARLAYTNGAMDLGNLAEAHARQMGLVGQPGTKLHSLVASLVGLSGKQRLSKFVRRTLQMR